MSWEKIGLALEKKYERNYVACHEPQEREFLRILITIQFPHLRRSKIENAITQACQDIESPRDRKVFLDYMAELLHTESGIHLLASKNEEPK